MQYFWCQTGAVALGFLLDLIFGDPHWLYHPVQLIGSLISKLEKVLLNLYIVNIKICFFEAYVFFKI